MSNGQTPSSQNTNPISKTSPRGRHFRESAQYLIIQIKQFWNKVKIIFWNLLGRYQALPKSTRWLVPIAFIFGIAMSSAVKSILDRNSLTHELTQHSQKATPVAAQKIEPRSILHQFFTHSYLQPKKEITLRPNSNVTVRQVMIEVGQKVKRGEVIAYTDSEAQALRAELDGIDFQLKNLDYSVTVALAKKSFISSKEYQQKELEHKASRLRAKLAKIETTGAIHSPINGTVSEVNLKSGDYIDNPSQYYIKIADASSFRLQLYLPQAVAAKLNKGSEAILSRTKTDEYGKESYEAAFGRVGGVAPVVDPKSGSVLTDIEVEKIPSGWIAGQYVQVTMTIDQAHEVVAVPNESIIFENGQPFVYRISRSDEQSPELRSPASENGSRVVKALVQTGLRDAKFTEVKEGVLISDVVITEGQGSLANNASVEVVR